jgi:hypothetical protein
MKGQLRACVDAHHAASRVQERAARVARVDGRVRLDGAPDAAAQLALDLPPQAADHAWGLGTPASEPHHTSAACCHCAAALKCHLSTLQSQG